MSDTGNSKPIYAKWWFWVIIIALIVGLFGNKEGTVEKTETSKHTKTATTLVYGDDKSSIINTLTGRITDKYEGTTIDEITINEDGGTSVSDDYIALVYLTWNVKNSGSTSKEMLNTYSSDLAATLGKYNSSVNEICIFWTVPYLNDTAKCSYERVTGGFREMDMSWGKAFG